MNAVPSQPRSLSDRFQSLLTFSWTAGRICRSKKFMVLMARSRLRVNARRGVLMRIGPSPGAWGRADCMPAAGPIQLLSADSGARGILRLEERFDYISFS